MEAKGSSPPAVNIGSIVVLWGGLALLGCARAPSPLVPAWGGAIGGPTRGVLCGGAELPRHGKGLRWLRPDDRHWGLPRFVRAIERAAAHVADERPGASLSAGDLSTPTGGWPLSPHISHRSGVDADLLFYLTTLDGKPIESPDFVHVGADGLARDPTSGRWLRLDLEREWMFVKELLEDPEARIQWVFESDVVQAMLIEWAMARGDSPETIARAERVMLQPNPGGIHDDHIHVRTTCSAAEMVTGCERRGPSRSWLADELPALDENDETLALSLMGALEPDPHPLPSPSRSPARRGRVEAPP